MNETAEKLKEELSRLSVQERAEIAYFLLHSLDEEVDDDAEIAWDTELARRMQTINDGTASSESSEDVIAELRQKYS